MPLKLIKKLDEDHAKIAAFREILKDAPILLDRAETGERIFRGLRQKILDEASDLYELKGFVPGVRSTADFTRMQQDLVREEVKEERMDPVVGKAIVKQLHETAVAATAFAASKNEELTRHAGKLDGYYYSATAALEEITAAIANFTRSAEMEEDDDWSGRGTGNGQRAPEKKNGKKKAKKPAKKAAKKAAPRVKREKAAEPPN